MNKEKENFYTAKSFYKNEVVKNYNKERTESTKWKREQKAAEDIIASFTSNSTFLDLPVGTGRLLPLFRKYDQKVYGVDISKDMLSYVQESDIDKSCIVELLEGDAENIPLPDNSVDAVLSFRLLNLVPFVVFTNIIKEFKRVSSGEIIFQIRVNEELSFIALIVKILLDPRTHLNRIAAYLIGLGKNLFFSSKKENTNDSGNIHQSYFIHDLEEVLKQLNMNNLTIKQTIEIDKGVDYSKGSYIPYLIFRCTQDK